MLCDLFVQELIDEEGFDVEGEISSKTMEFGISLLALSPRQPPNQCTLKSKRTQIMSNKVWVTWMDSISNEWLFDKVTELHADADISDLRKSLVAQQALSVSPAAVKVREAENGEMLQPDQKLTDYFVSDSKAASGPGRSKDSALFCTLPSPPIKQLLPPVLTLPSSSTTTTVSTCRSLMSHRAGCLHYHRYSHLRFFVRLIVVPPSDRNLQPTW